MKTACPPPVGFLCSYLDVLSGAIKILNEIKYINNGAGIAVYRGILNHSYCCFSLTVENCFFTL